MYYLKGILRINLMVEAGKAWLEDVVEPLLYSIVLKQGVEGLDLNGSLA